MAGCLGRIQETLPSMTPKEQQIAQYILAHSAKVSSMSLSELTKASDTSTATILRMCRKVGLDGFRDFIRLLSNDVALQESKRINFGEIHPGDSLESIAKNIIHNSTYALENTLSILDLDQLQQAVDLLCNARRIDFYGLGGSGYVALDAYSKFLRIGTLSMSSNNPHTQILSAISLTPQDAAVLISYSGETTDLHYLQHIIQNRGTPTIAVTQIGSNTLADAADIRLCTTALEPMVRIGPMTSRLSQMAILDILYVAVCTKKYESIKEYLEDSQNLIQQKHSR